MREIGRATQGVRLIRLDERDKVVAVAKVAPEDNEPGSNQRSGAGRNGEKGTTPQGGNGSAAPGGSGKAT